MPFPRPARRVVAMMPAESPSKLRKDLLRGRQQLNVRFGGVPVVLRAGELFASRAGSRRCIYRLQTGWACQFRDLPNGRRAIIDVYLPGDIIGVDARFGTRPVTNVLALTSVDAQVLAVESALNELMAAPCTALYVAWLLGYRQRRADQLLAAMSCFGARERMAMMVLDFYRRLRARRLIAAKTFNMPLTQHHIGEYLGLTVVHVNRVLRSLREDRIAALERSCITILDLDRLAFLAGKSGTSDVTGTLGPSNAIPPEDRSSHFAMMIGRSTAEADLEPMTVGAAS